MPQDFTNHKSALVSPNFEKSLSREIRWYNDRIALRFDKHPSNAAARATSWDLAVRHASAQWIDGIDLGLSGQNELALLVYFLGEIYHSYGSCLPGRLYRKPERSRAI